MKKVLLAQKRPRLALSDWKNPSEAFLLGWALQTLEFCKRDPNYLGPRTDLQTNLPVYAKSYKTDFLGYYSMQCMNEALAKAVKADRERLRSRTFFWTTLLSKGTNPTLKPNFVFWYKRLPFRVKKTAVFSPINSKKRFIVYYVEALRVARSDAYGGRRISKFELLQNRAKATRFFHRKQIDSFQQLPRRPAAALEPLTQKQPFRFIGSLLSTVYPYTYMPSTGGSMLDTKFRSFLLYPSVSKFSFALYDYSYFNTSFFKYFASINNYRRWSFFQKSNDTPVEINSNYDFGRSLSGEERPINFKEFCTIFLYLEMYCLVDLMRFYLKLKRDEKLKKFLRSYVDPKKHSTDVIRYRRSLLNQYRYIPGSKKVTWELYDSSMKGQKSINPESTFSSSTFPVNSNINDLFRLAITYFWLPLLTFMQHKTDRNSAIFTEMAWLRLERDKLISGFWKKKKTFFLSDRELLRESLPKNFDLKEYKKNLHYNIFYRPVYLLIVISLPLFIVILYNYYTRYFIRLISSWDLVAKLLSFARWTFIYLIRSWCSGVTLSMLWVLFQVKVQIIHSKLIPLLVLAMRASYRLITEFLFASYYFTLFYYPRYIQFSASTKKYILQFNSAIHLKWFLFVLHLLGLFFRKHFFATYSFNYYWAYFWFLVPLSYKKTFYNFKLSCYLLLINCWLSCFFFFTYWPLFPIYLISIRFTARLALHYINKQIYYADFSTWLKENDKFFWLFLIITKLHVLYRNLVDFYYRYSPYFLTLPVAVFSKIGSLCFSTLNVFFHCLTNILYYSKYCKKALVVFFFVNKPYYYNFIDSGLLSANRPAFIAHIHLFYLSFINIFNLPHLFDLYSALGTFIFFLVRLKILSCGFFIWNKIHIRLALPQYKPLASFILFLYLYFTNDLFSRYWIREYYLPMIRSKIVLYDKKGLTEYCALFCILHFTREFYLFLSKPFLCSFNYLSITFKKLKFYFRVLLNIFFGFLNALFVTILPLVETFLWFILICFGIFSLSYLLKIGIFFKLSLILLFFYLFVVFAAISFIYLNWSDLKNPFFYHARYPAHNFFRTFLLPENTVLLGLFFSVFKGKLAFKLVHVLVAFCLAVFRFLVFFKILASLLFSLIFSSKLFFSLSLFYTIVLRPILYIFFSKLIFRNSKNIWLSDKLSLFDLLAMRVFQFGGVCSITISRLFQNMWCYVKSNSILPVFWLFIEYIYLSFNKIGWWFTLSHLKTNLWRRVDTVSNSHFILFRKIRKLLDNKNHYDLYYILRPYGFLTNPISLHLLPLSELAYKRFFIPAPFLDSILKLFANPLNPKNLSSLLDVYLSDYSLRICFNPIKFFILDELRANNFLYLSRLYLFSISYKKLIFLSISVLLLALIWLALKFLLFSPLHFFVKLFFKK